MSLLPTKQITPSEEMQPEEIQISAWHSRIVMIAGGAAFFLGVLVLTGWYTRNTTFIQVIPASGPMQYNTALGFFLCGLALFSLALGKTRLSAFSGAVVGMIGLMTLIEYILGVNLGLDQLLMEHYIPIETAYPGRMAPNTALCFSLIATALLTKEWLGPFKNRSFFFGGLGGLTLILGLMAFIGYLTGASTAYRWGQLTRMAIHTAVGFIVLGIGILMVAFQDGARIRDKSTDISTTPRIRVFVLSITIMTVVTVTVGLNVVRELHHAAVEQKKSDLLAYITGWSNMIASLSPIDIPPISQDQSKSVLPKQVEEAYESLSMLDKNSEFVLARREDREIVFLLSQPRDPDQKRPDVVSFDSDRAEPMRRALLGESGTIVGLDYAGDVVLAAYTPFGPQHWGLVGKVHLSEVQAPFERASLLAGGVGIAIVLLGSIVFLLVVDPMIRGLSKRTLELREEVTERMRVEAELRKYQEQLEGMVETRTMDLQVANKDLKDFAYSVSHDLKAPLRAITGFSEIISRRHKDHLNEESRRYFNHIATGCSNMNRLIEDLLRYSRLGRLSVKTRMIPLSEVFSELDNTFQGRVKEIGGTLDFPENSPGHPPAVLGDATLLSQIFTNLVDNGLSYCRPDLSPKVEIRCATRGERVVVSVKDNGIGIPAEFQEKVFNIFQRLHSDADKSGTGIGLSLVKKAAVMLGSRVWLKSVEGEGCTFFVDLPLSSKGVKPE